jgi:release factor glutamine methyltransferase
MEETWTILRVLEWTTGYFKRKQIEQPRSNAEVLLSFVLGVERIQLYLDHDKPLAAAELGRYREAILRRAAREPTQYITGRQEFWSLDFEVNPSVLIPRPETELLVERGLDLVGQSPAKILDLGSGSGAIAVSLAHERTSLQLVAVDKSFQALEVARRNAARHRVADRIQFAVMDLCAAFSPDVSFDLIISNPPYISDNQLSTLSPEIRCHEPQMALRGGPSEGLNVVRKILEQAPSRLKPGGVLLMEIGQGHAELLEHELAGKPYIESYEFVKDYSGVLRILHVRIKTG